MSRETENALLLLVGLSTGIITLTGAYTRYVRPSQLPWLAAAAIFLIVLAATSIIRDFRRNGRDPVDTHTHRAAVVWMAVVPIVVLIFIRPPAISPRAVNTMSVTVVSTDVLRHPFPPLPDERAPTISLPDLLERFNRDTANTLDGRTITVSAFTLKEPDHVDIGIMHIICCAADARLLRVRLGGPLSGRAAQHPDQTWLRVEGIVRKGPSGTAGRPVPVLELSNVTPIDPPENPYA
ncbi:MAG TPA: TIGR03943 family protein [Mycobacterium sp.]|nr:TIGR03943 family protein [Mycobacterium sp.]